MRRFTRCSTSSLISWKQTGRLQQTLSQLVEVKGIGLHTGKESTVRIYPERAGKGRYFNLLRKSSSTTSKVLASVPASIQFAARDSPLCTSLICGGVVANACDGMRVSTIEHLLSALEGVGVDNCRIEIECSDDYGSEFEVPILDGSAKMWVEAIKNVGLANAIDQFGSNCEKLAPHLNEPVHFERGDSYLAAFPSPDVRITCGINFPQVPAIGCQWLSLASLDSELYIRQIAPARTFCVYEEVQYMRNKGLVKGGSLDNAVVFSINKGQLNPPLRFCEEPCRHKILDLIGDISLFAWSGNQGIPVAHIVVYKGGHALNAEFTRQLSDSLGN